MKKKEVITSNMKESLEAHASSLRRKIQDLALERDAEIRKIERLRNEAKDWEAQRRSLEISKASHASEKNVFGTYKIATEEAFKIRKNDLDLQEAAIERKRQQGMEAQKSASAILKAAEGTEARNAALLVKINNEKAKNAVTLEKTQTTLEAAKEERSKAEERVRLTYEAEKQNEAAKRMNEAENKRLEALSASLDAQKVRLDTALTEARVMKKEAEKATEAAKKTVSEGQLSVDRQYNEIEIQKKNLRVTELRIKKLASDKGITKELRALEGK